MDRYELERLEAQFRQAFPDTQHFIDDLVEEDGKVALRTTARATHQGEFQAISRTGKSIEFTALVIYRIRHVKIAEYWGEMNFSRLMRQLRSS
ncbi:MAG: hypothetical protein LZF62_40045 [Nitrospira sp.]|nr:MAG: hypothetical protein LZF62_40045 [Nitrospira sp.]